MNKFFFDRPTVNIITITLLVFIEALQILIIVALIFSFIPIPVPALTKKFFLLTQYVVRLKRDSLFYHVWIAAGIGLQGLLIFFNRRRLWEEDLGRKFLPYICTMAGFVIIQVFAVFKILLWADPWWARGLLYVSLGAGILARIFWPEFWRLISKVWTQLTSPSIPGWVYLLMDAGGLFILAFLVFTPDLDKVLFRIFSYDKFYHFDIFLMSPAWAYHKGMALNDQVITSYSLILPIIFNSLMKSLGKFDYPQAVSIMVGICSIYYLLFYAVLRYWLKSVLLALTGLALAVKLQFFHWGVFPLLWIYPSATPLRYFPDIFFLFFLLRFSQDLQLRWLAAGAAAVGLGLVWSLDVGVYMYGTLIIAVLSYVYTNSKRLDECGAIVLLPLMLALGVLIVCYGPLTFHAQFWQNTFEFSSLFLQGWGALPITDGLKDKQFFAFCMGLMIPVVYAGTLLYSLGTFLFHLSRRHLFMALVSVYGLGVYHYFIYRSGVTSYDVVIIPFIFVLLFWAQSLLDLCKDRRQIGLKVFLFVWALTALVTGFLFTYYPNALNLSGFDWAPEKKFYLENFDFTRDASLIGALTAPQEPVALISSFETKILIQADRRPFFYYFPVMESEHMNVPQQRGMHIYTYFRLKRTLRQLQEQKPVHLFIESRLFDGPDARNYEDTHEGFKQLMGYIRLHYQYQGRGQYLAALRLK